MAGAEPTRAELITQLKNAIKGFEIDRLHGGVNAANFLDQEDTIIQAIEMGSLNATAQLNAMRSRRASFNALLTPGVIRSVLDPIFLEFGKLLGFPEKDVPTIIRPRLSDDFIAAGDTIKTRDITFGSPVAGGGNVGDGELLRLNIDSDGEPIEAVFVETKTFIISKEKGADANTGTRRNREKFEVRGENLEDDEIQRTGSGLDTTLTLVDAAQSIVQNAGFDLIEGSEPLPSGIPSWVSSVTVDSTNYTFESGAGKIFQPRINLVETRRSLNIKALTATLTQRFDLRQKTISATQPFMMQLAINRSEFSGDGTITIKLGTATASVVLAAQVGHFILRLAIGSDSWPVNFNENEIDVEISRTGGTTGSVLIDDLIVVPFTKLVEPGGGGSWYVMVGGQTPFLLEDIFTAADVFATSDSVIQQWLWRGYGLWLPSDAAPSITDP